MAEKHRTTEQRQNVEGIRNGNAGDLMKPEKLQRLCLSRFLTAELIKEVNLTVPYWMDKRSLIPHQHSLLLPEKRLF